MSIFAKAKSLAQRYPIVIAAVVIYLYYLATTLDLFSDGAKKLSFWDYFLQYDSLIFLWLATAALIQLQVVKRAHKEEQKNAHNLERLFDRQEIYSNLLKDIMGLLQDNVNNPLAIISTTTQEIRRKFNEDVEINRWLDRIDGAMTRIHHTIRDLEAYEARKLLESSAETLSKVKSLNK
jgi:signal transduction histidine kinase